MLWKKANELTLENMRGFLTLLSKWARVTANRIQRGTKVFHIGAGHGLIEILLRESRGADARGDETLSPLFQFAQKKELPVYRSEYSAVPGELKSEEIAPRTKIKPVRPGETEEKREVTEKFLGVPKPNCRK